LREKFPVRATVSISVDSTKKAEKIVKVLTVESRSTPTLKFKVLVKKEKGRVVLAFKASDLTALRASINSFCRWVGMLNKVLNILRS